MFGVAKCFGAERAYSARSSLAGYLPVMLGSFIVMVMLVMRGERAGKMKPVFVWSIALLMLVQLASGLCSTMLTPCSPCCFLLCGLQYLWRPANHLGVASRSASRERGSLGVYNTLQALGLACGGALGGWLKQHSGTNTIFIFCSFVANLAL